MGASIANLSVRLSANIAGFATGMAKAVKPLTNFGGHVAAIGRKVFSLTGAITALAAGGGMVLLVKNSLSSIDATAKLADRLGITTEALGGLQHAANLSGVSAEGLTGGLEKMLKSIGEAATEGGAAGNALGKLGLNAEALANVAPDEAFRQIADGLTNIKNPAERAMVAMDLFGKAGQSLLPLLTSGSEGIKAAQAEAERLGLTFSRVDAAKVEAANDAMTRLQAVFTGVANTLAIQLAPFIDAAANKLANMASSGEGMGRHVVNAFEWVLTAVAKATDWLEALKAGFYLLKAGATLAILGIIGPLTLLIKGVEWLTNKLTKSKSNWGDTFGAMTENLVKQTDEAFANAGESWDKFQQGANSKAIAQTFADIRAKADQQAQSVAKTAEGMRGAAINTEDFAAKLKQAEANAKRVADTVAGLEKDVAQFGMTDSQKKLADLSALGAAPEQLEQAERALSQLDAMNAAKERSEKLQQRAAAVLADIQTPTQKYDRSLTELSNLLNEGMLTWQDYGTAVRKARQELEASGQTDPMDAPDLFRAGSAAAQRFIFDQTRGNSRLTKDDAPKKMVAEQKDTNRVLDRIEQNTRASGATELEVVNFR